MALSDTEKREIQAIISGNTELLIKMANQLGEDLKNLPTHQIRRFFSAVRQIKRDWRRDSPEAEKKARRQLLLLKPMLAYQKRRVEEIGKLEEVLSYAIDQVGEDKIRFDNFVDFFEAIVAYHTAYAKE